MPYATYGEDSNVISKKNCKMITHYFGEPISMDLQIAVWISWPQWNIQNDK